MSLTRLVMRLAAARAVRDKTLAGPGVFDSAVDPIDQTIAENRQPLIVVTTDEHALAVTGRDLGSGSHQCDLVIEIAIASRVNVPASDGQGGQITIPSRYGCGNGTDGGHHGALDRRYTDDGRRRVVGCLDEVGSTRTRHKPGASSWASFRQLIRMPILTR